jgi:hypothetical protein
VQTLTSLSSQYVKEQQPATQERGISVQRAVVEVNTFLSVRQARLLLTSGRGAPPFYSGPSNRVGMRAMALASEQTGFASPQLDITDLPTASNGPRDHIRRVIGVAAMLQIFERVIGVALITSCDHQHSRRDGPTP